MNSELLVILISAAPFMFLVAFIAWHVPGLIAEYKEEKQRQERRLEIKEIWAHPPKVQLQFTRKSEGYVYLIKRQSDGVYKIGLTSQVNGRIREHSRKNGPIEIIALWKVPDLRENELYALEITRQYFYFNGYNREYRQMDEQQVDKFINSFTSYLEDRYGQAKRRKKEKDLFSQGQTHLV